ncbi:hypothetical protein V4Y02_23795, partial [Escherichia coli]
INDISCSVKFMVMQNPRQKEIYTFIQDLAAHLGREIFGGEESFAANQFLGPWGASTEEVVQIGKYQQNVLRKSLNFRQEYHQQE